MTKIFSYTAGSLIILLFALTSLQSLNTINSVKVIPHQSQSWVEQ